MSNETCQDCGSPDPRVHLEDIALCDRCADRQVAHITGMPELPDPPSPVLLTGPDGRVHELRTRLWRAPTGIVVDLEEVGVPPGEGYQFSTLGAHDADIAILTALAHAQAEKEVGRLYLDPATHRGGWTASGDEVAGRLVWNDGSESGKPYDVVVDGRTLSWEELGQALESFEGWGFRLVIEERGDDVRPDADIVPLTLPPRSMAPADDGPRPTIDLPASPMIEQIFVAFLADQERRLAPRTYRNYADVIGLLRDCLNNYGHQSLDAAERARWEAAYHAGQEDAFVHLFGADKIADELGEFLGYFMIRKVMAGEELLRAAGTVTKRLSKWLGEHGFLDPDVTAMAAEQAKDAARDLPRAERLSRLLAEQARRAPVEVLAIDEDDIVEDYLMIERVEPGELWFEGGIGPVSVAKKASDLARPGWSINIVLARTGRAWQVLEVGNVYP